MLTFGDILKQLMQSRGINQKWLADEADTTEATISRYVNGIHKPNIDLVISIAKALDVSVDFLLGLTPVPNSRLNQDPSARLLISCYNKADDHVRENVWFQFRDYLTPDEKSLLLSFRQEQEPKKSGTA